MYAMLPGRRKFIVFVAAAGELSLESLEFIKLQLTENNRIERDYPHVASYAIATGGKAIKANYQLRSDGRPSGIEWSKSSIVLPSVVDEKGKDYRSNGAVFECYGITGSIRGRTRTKSG